MSEDNNIPTKESNVGGIPIQDGTVRSAQEQILLNQRTLAKEQSEVNEESTETQEDVSAQAMEDAESVENEVVNSEELTAEDLVDNIPEQGQQDTSKYSIDYNGTNLEVDLEELKSGYMKQADYTKKAQEIAEQRQQFEQELAATQQERQRYLSQLEQFDTQSDKKIQELESTDWAKLKEEDPMEWAMKRDQLRELQDNKRLVAEEQKNLQQKQQTEMQQKWNEELQRQQQIMAQRLPEWNDPEKGPKLKQSIKSFATKKGFTEQEVDSLIDARSVDVLHKAMLYETLLEAKISNKKAKVVPKMQKPGTPSTKSEVNSEKIKQKQKRLKMSGKTDDAAAVIESLLKQS